MPDKNGTPWWAKWLVGALWGVVVLIILFLGNVVNANKIDNTREHTAIRKEISEFSVEQMRQGTILERIDRKL